MSAQPVTLVIVDDDAVSVKLVKRALRDARIANSIVTAGDGVEALELLRGTPDKPALKRPLLVLLDLNMPRMTGHEFLRHLRADDSIRDTTVFVMTTSTDKRDVREAYRGNVAGYVSKQAAGVDFRNAIQLLETYWNIVELPCGPD